jgi:hypothetical protein
VAFVGVGAAMLLSLLLYAHPTIGSQAQWPWQHWTETASGPHRADLLLWAGVGVLAVLAGVGALGRSGAAWLLPPAALLAARCCAPGAALGVRTMSVAWLAATVALGAGLLARASRRPGGAFRPLLLLGAAGSVAMLAVLFPEASGRSFLGERLAALPDAWRGELLVQEVWRLHAPFLAQGAAVLVGLLLAALPAAVPGGRLFASLAFAGLVLTWVLPAASLAVDTWDEVSRSPRKAAEIAAVSWFGAGLGLFLLGSVVVGALARPTVPAPEDPA